MTTDGGDPSVLAAQVGAYPVRQCGGEVCPYRVGVGAYLAISIETQYGRVGAREAGRHLDPPEQKSATVPRPAPLPL